MREKIEKPIKVPNMTKRKLHYRIESDLVAGDSTQGGVGTLSGPDTLTVLPGQSGIYDLTLSPLRRGRYTGVLAFVAGDNPAR